MTPAKTVNLTRFILVGFLVLLATMVALVVSFSGVKAAYATTLSTCPYSVPNCDRQGDVEVFNNISALGDFGLNAAGLDDGNHYMNSVNLWNDAVNNKNLGPNKAGLSVQLSTYRIGYRICNVWGWSTNYTDNSGCVKPLTGYSCPTNANNYSPLGFYVWGVAISPSSGGEIDYDDFAYQCIYPSGASAPVETKTTLPKIVVGSDSVQRFVSTKVDDANLVNKNTWVQGNAFGSTQDIAGSLSVTTTGSGKDAKTTSETQIGGIDGIKAQNGNDWLSTAYWFVFSNGGSADTSTAPVTKMVAPFVYLTSEGASAWGEVENGKAGASTPVRSNIWTAIAIAIGKNDKGTLTKDWATTQNNVPANAWGVAKNPGLSEGAVMHSTVNSSGKYENYGYYQNLDTVYYYACDQFDYPSWLGQFGYDTERFDCGNSTQPQTQQYSTAYTYTCGSATPYSLGVKAGAPFNSVDCTQAIQPVVCSANGSFWVGKDVGVTNTLIITRDGTQQPVGVPTNATITNPNGLVSGLSSYNTTKFQQAINLAHGSLNGTYNTINFALGKTGDYTGTVLPNTATGTGTITSPSTKYPTVGFPDFNSDLSKYAQFQYDLSVTGNWLNYSGPSSYQGQVQAVYRPGTINCGTWYSNRVSSVSGSNQGGGVAPNNGPTTNTGGPVPTTLPTYSDPTTDSVWSTATVDLNADGTWHNINLDGVGGSESLTTYISQHGGIKSMQKYAGDKASDAVLCKYGYANGTCWSFSFELNDGTNHFFLPGLVGNWQQVGQGSSTPLSNCIPGTETTQNSHIIYTGQYLVGITNPVTQYCLTKRS